MRDRKIAFIICVNDVEYYKECIRYIQDLYVPEGYEIEVLGVQDAESTVQAYNEGMHASDAKYKVYLQQNTFVINQYFIQEALEVFRQNENIGMLGVVGNTKIPDGNKRPKWNVGKILEYDGRCIRDTDYLKQPDAGAYGLVEAVDDVLIMTQHDIEWDVVALKDGVAYYIAQSAAMRKRGYQVVIPYQKQAWCYHDCGVREQEPEKRNEAINLRKLLVRYMELHAYEELCQIVEVQRENWGADTQLREIMNLMEIYTLEEMSETGIHSEWFYLQTWEQMYTYYMQVHWSLIRLGFGKEDERIAEVRDLVESGKVSRDAIRKVANISLVETSNVFQYFWKQKAESPLVSVCVPVYNGASFVRETIDSILKQTYQNLELLVVDDCSSDESREIIKSYKDSRVKPIFMEESGNVCRASNIAFSKAAGKYIALIGHDDIWKEDKLEKQVAFMEEHPSMGACFTWTDFIDENFNIVNYDYYGLYLSMNADNKSADHWLSSMVLNTANWACAPSACIRKDVLERVGYYRYGLLQLQDYELWLRILCETSIYVLQEKLTLYRRFKKKGKNLSSPSQDVQNGEHHEMQWILESVINGMPDERFITVFKERLRKKDATSHKEILCEKAFLLWGIGCCFAEKNFIELLEDETCREILEKEYMFTLNDFYKMNKKGMYFDYSFYPLLREERDENQYQ